jgi:hypothetical protein
MKEINIQDLNALHEIEAVFTSDFPVAILEFPKVYGLIAPHSVKGAQAIDQVKQRLPGKYYSSFLGQSQSFQQMIPDDLVELYQYINTNISGAFFRIPVTTNIKRPNITSCNQTHQYLIESGEIRKFIELIERQMQSIHKHSEIYDHNFQAPIISSLNTSGSISGAIVDREIALKFGINHKVPLFIHTGLICEPLGSYPIFSISKEGEIVEKRGGLNQIEIIQKIERFNGK